MITISWTGERERALWRREDVREREIERERERQGEGERERGRGRERIMIQQGSGAFV